MHPICQAEWLGPEGRREPPQAVSKPQCHSSAAPPPRRAGRLLCEPHRWQPSHAAEAGQRLPQWRGSFGSRRPHSPASSRVATRRDQCCRPHSTHYAAREEPATVSPLVHPRERWRGGVLATNHILALFPTPPLSKAFDCSLVRRKSLKDARKEGPEESGLAGGPRRSASWGRGRGKGRGDVVPLKPSVLETFLFSEW